MGFWQHMVCPQCESKSLQHACIKFSNFMPIHNMSIVTTPTFIISGLSMNGIIDADKIEIMLITFEHTKCSLKPSLTLLEKMNTGNAPITGFSQTCLSINGIIDADY